MNMKHYFIALAFGLSGSVYANCDYSNAAQHNGWGWNPVTQQSCSPSDNPSNTPQVGDYADPMPGFVDGVNPNGDPNWEEPKSCFWSNHRELIHNLQCKVYQPDGHIRMFQLRLWFDLPNLEKGLQYNVADYRNLGQHIPYQGFTCGSNCTYHPHVHLGTWGENNAGTIIAGLLPPLDHVGTHHKNDEHQYTYEGFGNNNRYVCWDYVEPQHP